MLDAVKLTQELIKIPSMADENETYFSILSYIRSLLIKLGVKADIISSVYEHEKVLYSDIKLLSNDENIIKSTLFKNETPKYNLISSVTKDCIEYPHLIVHAHVDTVSVYNPEERLVDIFNGEIVDGKIYGLGAADNKSGIAIAICIFEYFIKNIDKGKMTLLFTGDEERGGYRGAGYIANILGIRGDIFYTTNGNCDRVDVGNMGRLWTRVKKVSIEDAIVLKNNINLINQLFCNKRIGIKLNNMSFKENRLIIIFFILSLNFSGKVKEAILEVLSQFICIKNFEFVYVLPPMKSKNSKYLDQFTNILSKRQKYEIKKVLGAPSDMRFFINKIDTCFGYGPMSNDSNNHEFNENVEIKNIYNCLDIMKEYLDVIFNN